MKVILLAAYLLVTWAIAAFADDGRFGCKPVVVRDLGLDETTPLGFTVRDVLERLQGEHVFELKWHNGKSERARLVIAYAGGPVTYVEQVFDDAGTGREIALPCGNHLEAVVTLQLETEESQLDERLTATIIAPSLTDMHQSIDLDPDSLSNPDLLRYAGHEPGPAKPMHLTIETRILEGIRQGEMYLLSMQSEAAGTRQRSMALIKTPLARWRF